MDDITAIANELLARGGNRVDPFKLQYLLYYVQVISLVKHGKPAYNAELEAWNEGPAIKQIWERYKRFGRGVITVPISEQRPEHQQVLLAIATVMTLYGAMTADQLNLLIQHERPWVHAHGQGRNMVMDIDSIQRGYVRIGQNIYALPLQENRAQVQIALEQAACDLRPDRDNEEAILTIAEQDYTLLTQMVLTHAYLDYRVMTDIVYGIASEWIQHPEAAEKALLIVLNRPEPSIQEEALHGLDRLWRANHASAHLAAQVMALDLVVPKPKWAI